MLACPLTDLPVFVKAGGIVPMQNIIQSTNEAGDGILLITRLEWWRTKLSLFIMRMMA
jgi:alpha-glucosidase (family GH31 glycosyl hydrolase)